MLKIYGSRLCPDCVQCLEALDAAGVKYEYLDFGESLPALKAFLKLRELPLFAQVRQEGKIGIPCLLDDSGTVSLSWDPYVDQGKP